MYKKTLVSRIDQTEGGRRRLTEYVNRLEEYIKTIEFQESDGKSGRIYDIDGREYGLDQSKKWQNNSELGYMPHYILTATESMKNFMKFAHDKHDNRTAFEVFSDNVRLFEGSQGVINRVKGRTLVNEEYYSRNPLLFLSKYTHEVANFNKTKHLELQFQNIQNMFVDAMRKRKDFGDQEAVDQFLNSASETLNALQTDLMPMGERTTSGFVEKTGRFLTSMAFIRTMGFNFRSVLKNASQIAQEKIATGWMAGRSAKNYLTDTNLDNTMKIEATRHGLVWAKDAAIWGDLQKDFNNSLAASKGSFNESELLPGLKEIVSSDGSRKIVLADPTMLDRISQTIEGVAVKGSVMHSWVETMNRMHTFKVGWARSHENLSKAPDWYIKDMMGNPDASPAQMQNWINAISGKLAYSLVTDIHYEYGSNEKPGLIKGPVKGVVGQFQHYRMSLFNWQHNIIKRGIRDVRAEGILGAHRGEHSRQMIRMGATYAIVNALTEHFGVGFSNILSNDNFEWLQNNFRYFTAERDENGNLTEAGKIQAERATYGSGTFSLLGPSIGGLIEFGTLMNFWEVNNDHYISFLSSPSNDANDLDEEDYNYKIARLFNIQAARSMYKTWPAIANQNRTKAFMTETGLYVPYETRKHSQEFWQWVREITGTPTTGKPSYPSQRRMPTGGLPGLQ